MRAWQLFWTAALLVAGGSFAFITAVVIYRGLRDLREMFSALRAQQEGRIATQEKTMRREK